MGMQYIIIKQGDTDKLSLVHLDYLCNSSPFAEKSSQVNKLKINNGKKVYLYLSLYCTGCAAHSVVGYSFRELMEFPVG